MIQFSVSRSVFDTAYSLMDYPIAGYAGTLHAPVPLVLIGSPAEDPTTRDVSWGYLQQGSKPIGKLRDKSVLHLKAEGQVEYNTSTDLSPYDSHVLLTRDCGYKGDGWSLEAGEQTRRISGDDYLCVEQSGHVVELDCWGYGDHFIISWLHVAPRVLAYDWMGRFAGQISAGAQFRRSYHYSLQGTSFYYRSEMMDGNFSFIVRDGQSYELTPSGISDLISACSNDPFVLQNGSEIEQGGGQDLVPSELLDALEFAMASIPKSFVYKRALPHLSADEWGSLTVDLKDQLELVESNQMLNFLDLAGYATTIGRVVGILESRDFADLAALALDGLKAGVSTFKSFVKALSGAYLMKKYVVDTSVSDAKEVQQGLKDFMSRPKLTRLHSRQASASTQEGYVVDHTAVLTVEIGTYPTWFTGRLQEFIGKAKSWGLYPDVTNLYDMLQYSFVLDWFVGVGDLVSSVNDYMDVLWYFPVDHSIQSERWTFTVLASELLPDYPGLTGSVQFSYYTRWVSSDVPMPPVHLETGSGLSTTSRGSQATALAVQRLR